MSEDSSFLVKTKEITKQMNIALSTIPIFLAIRRIYFHIVKRKCNFCIVSKLKSKVIDTDFVRFRKILWYKNREIFAIDFVDDFYKDDSKINVWTADNLAQAKK
jgi:hypothetical protein